MSLSSTSCRRRWQTSPSSSALDRSEIVRGGWRKVGVEDYRNPLEMRRGLFEQLQPLATNHRFATAESGSIALGPGNVFHQTNGGRVTAPSEDDRDGLRRLLQRTRRRSPPATITSGARETSSAAEARSRFVSAAPKHRSIFRSRPSIQPSLASASRSAILIDWDPASLSS
jgi:hypothetical protein